MEKKEKLAEKFNELTSQINDLNQDRIKILGKIELLEEQEKEKKDA
jgi:Txe/YoeB family toxin of Txe-Axe toxin-antitoxin module